MKKKKLDLRFKDRWSSLKESKLVPKTQFTQPTKLERVSLAYAIANDLDIEHASVVAQKVLFTAAHVRTDENDLTFYGSRALANEMKDSSPATDGGEKEFRFRLRLSEAVAVHHQNFDVFEDAALNLCKMEKSEDVHARAASMAESFFSLLGEHKSTFEVGAPGLRMEDEGTMMKVLSLVEMWPRRSLRVVPCVSHSCEYVLRLKTVTSWRTCKRR